MIKVYSTGCPHCVILESMLKAKNIEYTKISDEDEIVADGVMSIPTMDVDGNRMDFPKAYNYVRGMK